MKGCKDMRYNEMYNATMGKVRYIMNQKKNVLKIAICDDEKGLCSELESMLENIGKKLNISMEISIWFSGESIRDYLEKGNQIDIIFLDIELIKLTGIDIGSYIRNSLYDVKTQIVYISSKTSYALKLFKTQPYDFLVKPINQKDLFDVISGILKIIETKNQMFQYQSGREINKVAYDEILYFKSDRHKVVAVTKGKEIVFYGKLKEVASDAPPQFLAIHKSYLVNQDYVIKYTFDFVEMKNHDILTISKAYQKEVREKISHRKE